ncbi:late competence development ComFB family protein [Tumebacillus sp. ITR2]|uniref:Late competence development ComFB family protein n=1 Tax=Tumebacillus amylolyticus TaxID=2801339 RepID=A0ABS1JEP1_9BACL|nr:late competence development ComFB family protein [Tumebacillus amylolyticus]MBL0388772.1 late competence development ComFB family protein [Tumebacillus amylolyticus]
MKVVNLMERVVEAALEQQWKHLRMPCDCEICKNDVLALTLNALPTRYVSNDRGRMIVQARMMDEQYQADVLREMSLASEVVAKKPSHTIENS